MGKLAVLIMMIGLIWIGMQVNSDGVDNAFGGAFSFLNARDDLPEKASEFVTTRVGAKVDSAIQEGAARYEKMLKE